MQKSPLLFPSIFISVRVDHTWGVNWSVPSPWPPTLLFPSLNVYTPCFLFFVLIFFFLFFKLLHLFQTQSSGLLWPPLRLWSRFSFNGADRTWGSLRSCAGCRVEEEPKIGPFPEHPLWQKQSMLLSGMAVSFLVLTKKPTLVNYLSLVGV